MGNDMHTHSEDGSVNIKIAFYLNLGFTILEIAGGIAANSLAIIADALHDLGDSFSLGLSWYFEKYSKKGNDSTFSYGYRRFSLLGALTNAALLIIGSIFILAEALPRIMHPQESSAGGMFVLAVIGVAVNGFAFLRLRGGKTLNTRIIAWHLLEDVLGWMAVLIVSVTLFFKKLYVLDPVLSILVTSYVLYNVVKNLRATVFLFLQAVPEGLDINAIEERLLTVPRVESLHHTHLWSLDGEHHVLTTHVVVDPHSTKEDVLNVKCDINGIAEELKITHTTVEIEYQEEECRMKKKL
jgi:cobalt-zinc-cadmium efflux system protein